MTNQLAGEQADRREEVGAIARILDLSHRDDGGDGSSDAHQRRMAHCDDMRRHT